MHLKHCENNLGLIGPPPVDPWTTIIFVGGIAVTGLLSFLKRFARGNYQKFRREYYDDFLRKARNENKSVTAFWFGEGVQVKPDGGIEILGKFETWLQLAEFLKTLAGCKYGYFFGNYNEYCFAEPPVDEDDTIDKIIDVTEDIIDWLSDRGREWSDRKIRDYKYLDANLTLPEAIEIAENYWWIWLLVAGAVIAKRNK